MKRAIEPIFVPYCGHTSAEMIRILKSKYREANGDHLDFSKSIIGSSDPRLYAMNHFAIDVLYEFCKELEEGIALNDNRQSKEEDRRLVGKSISQGIPDDDNKKHWYCLTFAGTSMDGQRGCLAGTYVGYDNERAFNVSEINLQKRNAGVKHDAVLKGITYLGYMTKEVFTEGSLY